MYNHKEKKKKKEFLKKEIKNTSLQVLNLQTFSGFLIAMVFKSDIKQPNENSEDVSLKFKIRNHNIEEKGRIFKYQFSRLSGDSKQLCREFRAFCCCFCFQCDI